MPRGALTKKKSKMLTIWVPECLIPLIDEGVKRTDSDRSKFVRGAIRSSLLRLGIRAGDGAAHLTKETTT
jgi:hypothetical protein